MIQPVPKPAVVINERLVLLVLALVQFTHVMDFMIMMPLGPQLMRHFAVTPAEFSHLVAAYAISAAMTGFLAAFFLDRFDRRQALLFLYAGFGVGTLLCALAPSYWSMLGARVVAGGFGGVSGSVVVAIVGDLIPGKRRGRAMAVVMSSFSVASIMGVPAGLWLANRFEWHAPFFLLAGASVVVLVIAFKALPPLRGHRGRAHQPPIAQMRAILGHRDHQRGLALSAFLVASGAVIFPFMPPAMVANAGLSEAQLPLIYICGGACTFGTMLLLGRLSDRYHKLGVLSTVAALSAVAVLIITRLGPVSVTQALVATTFLMVTMSGRFTPAMAMITNAIEPQMRGGFMSVNSAVQQISTGLAALGAGMLVRSDPSGHIVGFPRAGILSIVLITVAVYLGWRLCASVPSAARAGKPGLVATATAE